MLGLRGCRLGLMIPDFVKIQTRAILNAQIAVRKAGGDPIAKIMIPLVGHVNELRRDAAHPRGRGQGGREAAGGIEVDYKFGTMIEVPRGALTADEIAHQAELLQLRHERPDPDDVRLQPRRRRGQLPAQVRRGRHPAGEPVPDAGRRGRRPDEDGGRQGPRDAARHRAGHLRRARRRPGVDRQVRADRAGLRVVLAVPGAGRPPRRRAGRARRRRRQVARPAFAAAGSG